ncbi:unnamed protein product [Thelazia callipaeda]|uniref:BAR domain-containing protein n=1 Tax=Thelazia callipaeda TaxID=103827 RepID=A0A0N5CLJ9_THECL|nr:unnamed protein product [Thelazia callipaeda]
MDQAKIRHPDDESKQEKSKEATTHYEEQLKKVKDDAQEFPLHYKKTAKETNNLLKYMADHFDSCAERTKKHLQKAKNGSN